MVTDEYGWFQMRRQELIGEAEQARLAGEARRSGRAADRFRARSARWLTHAVARLWHRPTVPAAPVHRRALGWSSLGGNGVRRTR
jgi:hypothetical protein